MGFGAGAGEDQCMIAFDPSGNMFYSADFYRQPCQLIFGPDTLTSDEQETFFMAKYTNVFAHDTTYAHKDTAICNTTTGLTLTAPPGYASYAWNDGETTAAINITSSGHYFVYCQNPISTAIRDRDRCRMTPCIPEVCCIPGRWRKRYRTGSAAY